MSGIVIGRYLGTVVVTVHGELEPAQAADLHHALTDLIEGQGNLCVVVDLRDATAADATQVDGVADVAERADRRGGVMVFSEPPELVVEALGARGLGHLVVGPGDLRVPSAQGPASG